MNHTLDKHLTEVLKDEEFLIYSHHWSASRMESSTRQHYQLARYSNLTDARVNFEVADDHGMSKLLWRSTGEEVVLEICGIIAKSSLPPVVSNRSGFTLNPGRPHTTVQRITLVGPNDIHFASGVAAMSAIYELHRDSFPAGMLKTWKPTFVGQHAAIDAGTRIITLDEQQRLMNVPVPHDLDPEHILRDMVASKRYTYCEDNVVRYMEAISDKQKQNFIRLDAKPASFRPGQIVQLSVSFRTLLTQHGTRIFLVLLDSVLLLDRLGAQMVDDSRSSSSQHIRAILAQKSIRKRRGDDDTSFVAPPEKKSRPLRD